jgi:hypothetical protein
MTSINFRALITAFLFLAIATAAIGIPRNLLSHLFRETKIPAVFKAGAGQYEFEIR